MEISIRANAKEIADLVLALQGQRDLEYVPLEVIREAVQKASCNTEGA